MRPSLVLFTRLLYLGLALVWGQGLEAMSPMATGRWARIAVPRSGLYVLEASELRALGFEHPERVRIWGHGGRLLPEVMARIEDRALSEVPSLWEDGRVYFYGEGPTTWYYSEADDFYHHTTNHYTSLGYYLLSEGDSPLRMGQVVAEPHTSPSPQDARYIHPLVHEQDSHSLSGSGRRLYGESLRSTTRLSHTHTIAGAERVRGSLAFMAFPRSADAVLQLSLVGQAHTTATARLADMITTIASGTYHVYGLHRESTGGSWISLASDHIIADIELSTAGISSHLDYYELNVEARLAYSGTGQLHFSRPMPRGVSSTGYVLEGVEGIRLFKVDACRSAMVVDLSALPPSTTLAMRLPATDASGQPCRYLALRLAEAYKPQIIGTIPNQNLLGTAEAPDLFIITTEALRAPSLRLAEHYRAQGQSVLVATQGEVFNEFGGGTPDATAYRLAVRHLVDLYRRTRGTTDVGMQLLLVGDAAYDNRRLTPDWRTYTDELLLSYQSLNSLDLASYTSDDYFGIVADELPKRGIGTSTAYPELHELPLDIGVGRLPVRTASEAMAVIDKIIGYETRLERGPWRMRAAFVADNGDGNSHTRQSIEIGQVLETTLPELRLDKIYMSAHMRQSIGGKVSVPSAKKALLASLARGVSIINYNGHGSPRSWAQEQLLTIDDIKALDSPYLPLWITATCDFAPFDAPSTSAGEEVLLHPTSGGIALLSTTRVVYDLPNLALNKAVLRELLTRDASGHYRPLGLVIRDAKNALRTMPSPENRLNFVLLGSPLTRLQLPSTDAVVHTIGGTTPSATHPVELSALQQVRVEGYVRSEVGVVDGDFEGTIHLAVYDAERELSTIDNFDSRGIPTPPISYRDYPNLIYEGTAPVRAGYYSLDFVIPRDVAYQGTAGLISLYAYDATRTREAIGANTHWRIAPGGTPDLSADTIGPKILALRLGAHDVASSPRVPVAVELYAHLRDDTALNLSNAGIGHRISLSIDNRLDMRYDLGSYYTPLASSGEGEIRFPMPELAPGHHTARLELWDVYNNATVRTFAFSIQPGLAPRLVRLEVTPNPSLASSDTRLRAWHDLGALPLEAELSLYDLGGRCLQVLPWQRTSASSSGAIELSIASLASTLPPATYIIRLGLRRSAGAAGYASIKWIKAE